MKYTNYTNFLQKVSPFVYQRLIWQHKAIGEAVKKGVKTVEEKLKKEMKIKSPSQIKKLLLLSKNSPALLKYLVNYPESWVRKAVAKHPDTHPRVLVRLSKDKDNSVKLIIAKRRDAPLRALDNLSLETNEDILKEVVSNPATPMEIIKKLLKRVFKGEEGLDRLKEYIIGKIGKRKFEELSKDKDPDIRAIIAIYPKTSVKTLIKLSRDKNAIVRASVAHNLKTPLSLLIKLSKDKDSFVRFVVCENPRTPIKILDRLTRDRELDGDQMMLIVYNLESLAKNPKTSVKKLEQLSKLGFIVREAVANNPSTPIYILKRLAKDRRPSVKEAALEALRERLMKR